MITYVKPSAAAAAAAAVAAFFTLSYRNSFILKLRRHTDCNESCCESCHFFSPSSFIVISSGIKTVF